MTAQFDAFDGYRNLPLFPELAEAFSGRRLLLAGGTGFVGKWLLEALAALGAVAGPAEVTVLCRSPERFRAAWPRLAVGVRLVAADVTRLVPDATRWDYIIHAANDTGPAATDAPEELMRTIVDGTRRLLDCAVAANTRGFLLVSSGAVYGPMPADLSRFPEDHPGAPDPADLASAYGQAKRVGETLCAVYHRRFGLPAKIARGFSFAGEYLPLDAQLAFGNFVRDALESERITVRGDGTPVRSYLYGADMALWLLRILTAGAPARPYNVGSDEGISLSALAHRVAATLAPDTPVHILGVANAGIRSRYVPAVERARTELGVDVWTDLTTTIRRTAVGAAGTVRNKS